MESLGICLGASSIGIVRLRQVDTGIQILWKHNKAHGGNPKRALNEALAQIDDLADLRIAATGRKFRNQLALSSIPEPQAVELAYGHVNGSGGSCNVIVSAGGETFMAYHLDGNGKIQGIHSGNKCASGTGEFFLQQLKRMGSTVTDTSGMSIPENIYKLSGRCSVFCKSDCTHALNKGTPKDQVVAGLSRMMAWKIVELLKKIPKSTVMLIGGCSRNKAMTHFLRQEIPDLYIPDEAVCFEALGAALWAMQNKTQSVTAGEDIFLSKTTSLSYHQPLENFQSKVHFKNEPKGEAVEGDRVILGLDVGSTTTKGVIMRRSDKSVLASDYLRTNGNPIEASRQVYKSLDSQLNCSVVIEGLGVTGSGRQIAGLHAMTDGVINEIIAHATAAVHFDPDVDTIFEIGGQDAKYTYIVNGVPSDYAMNEACSAGTGSFLEESAMETLGLDVTEIGKTAYEGQRPPNFNDQCAAFISSDINRAVQENIPFADIIAGLVYSICMNYTNRVKGNRPVGKKVLMQGGVCYNSAIPAAMAALTGKEIIVPPDPGLMGAFGVALEVENRMESGLLQPQFFDLKELSERQVQYEKSFICGGGKRCDRGCEIARIRIADKIFPFGGICSRYENQIHKRKIDTDSLNLAAMREQRVFRDLAPDSGDDLRPTVGMNRSFLVNTYFPFYNTFFAELGFRLVLPDVVTQEGIDQRGAPFCYPVELCHGYAHDLLSENPDYIFIPHLRGIPTGNGTDDISCTCVLVQGEPFYLKSAFPALESKKVLTPSIDFSQGLETQVEVFKNLAMQMGADPDLVPGAMKAAIEEQAIFFDDIKAIGSQALEKLKNDREKTAIILFGRPYNSFAAAANQGIPLKFASRDHFVIPFDMLPFEEENLEAGHNMYWAMGRIILKAARFVKKEPQLYGAYITNFSCGPDSFIVGYFRDTMKSKPSLTLELDSHTADAGIETRVEAFLDIVHNHRLINKAGRKAAAQKEKYRGARMKLKNKMAGIELPSSEWVPLSDERVKMILPSMGKHGTGLLARALACRGIHAEALPPADEEVMKLGRGNSSCKECLPLQLTVGSMLTYLNKRPKDEITAFFMASADGPCRFGQYHVFAQKVLDKHKIEDAVVMSLTSTNGYGGFGQKILLAGWRAIVIGDIFDEMWATVLAGAEDREAGLQILEKEYKAIRSVIHKGWLGIAKQLSRSSKKLAAIQLKKPYEEIPKISLIGEIYVRHDPISLQNLIERFADQGFIVRTAPNSEWLKYVDWLVQKGIEGKKKISFTLQKAIKDFNDREIRKRLAPSGLFYHNGSAGVEHVIAAGKKYISTNLTGEAILTVGSAFHEILEPASGILSIGPFGCMPTRLAESILSEKFTTTEKKAMVNGKEHPGLKTVLANNHRLPFLSIETDGKPFPQIIEARLEALCLQALRTHEMMLNDSTRQPHASN